MFWQVRIGQVSYIGLSKNKVGKGIYITEFKVHLGSVKFVQSKGKLGKGVSILHNIEYFWA